MDELQAAVRTCFNKYADFTGRASRAEYWWFVLFMILVLAITRLASPYLQGVAVLALTIPGLAAGARRLHDTGKSGWFQLVQLIPFVGTLVLIYLTVQPGQPGANLYGEPPTGGVAGAEMAPGQQ